MRKQNVAMIRKHVWQLVFAASLTLFALLSHLQSH
jgi:hypothetical protein